MMNEAVFMAQIKKGVAALLLAAVCIPALAADAARDFTLKSHDGSNLRLAEMKGQVVMLNFWASWCGPCRQEMPILEQLNKKYGKLGFTVWGINVDEDPAMAEKLLKETGVTFPVLFDSRNEVSELYGVDAMPTTVMVDRDGNIRFRHRSYKPGTEEEYEKQIKSLVRE
jgi:peroxiredoxin